MARKHDFLLDMLKRSKETVSRPIEVLPYPHYSLKIVIVKTVKVMMNQGIALLILRLNLVYIMLH